MLKRIRKILKYTILSFVVTVVLLIATVAILIATADLKQPKIDDQPPAKKLLVMNNYRQYGDNFLRQSESGLWEMKVSGKDYERGLAIGILSRDLLYEQEKAFVDQIRVLVPSDGYLKFLHRFIQLYNRKLADYVPEENRREIYGISLSCTSEYDFIGTPYERQLNYHSAHDLGHAMQDYMLVGCSSFAAWGSESANSELIVGRNFDFYVGDDFARNKLVQFYQPDSGYSFVSIAWPGMTGVLSGMNRQGLTVSINAAKSSIPLAAKTPISILTRQILQYAANIEQAYSIACQYSTFVSESILIGSAEENCAAIIEKSPEKTSLYRSPANTLHIICTNHYQSPEFADDCRNLENIAHSDSPARYSRIAELLAQKTPVDPADAADILRDTCGVGSTSIGLTSELALNQFIGHHSVIFLPHKRLIWVSTSPWQAGKYVAYDLNSIFGDSVDFSHEIYEPSLAIDADSMLQTHLYTNLVTYKRLAKTLRRAIDNNTTLPQDTLQCFLASNPNYYCTYSLLGDYALAHGKTDMALQYWQKAVAMPIPKKEERQSLRKKIYRCFNSCIKNKACSPDK